MMLSSPFSVPLLLSLFLLTKLVLGIPLPDIPLPPTTNPRFANTTTNVTTPERLPIPNHQHRRLPSELVLNPGNTKVNASILSNSSSSSSSSSSAIPSNTTVPGTVYPPPQDIYTCYDGPASSFPASAAWISLSDMWAGNQGVLTSGCGWFGVAENTQGQVDMLWDALLSVAGESGVDARFILGVVLQESNGCLNVPSTNNGVENNGIMQSFQGVAFVGDSADPQAQAASIEQMLVDGTQGTMTGFGLVQGINKYGNVYDAARMYNSGSVDLASLNDPVGATASYVVDVANRMTGWVDAPRLSC